MKPLKRKLLKKKKLLRRKKLKKKKVEKMKFSYYSLMMVQLLSNRMPNLSDPM